MTNLANCLPNGGTTRMLAAIDQTPSLPRGWKAAMDRSRSKVTKVIDSASAS